MKITYCNRVKDAIFCSFCAAQCNNKYKCRYPLLYHRHGKRDIKDNGIESKICIVTANTKTSVILQTAKQDSVTNQLTAFRCVSFLLHFLEMTVFFKKSQI